VQRLVADRAAEPGRMLASPVVASAPTVSPIPMPPIPMPPIPASPFVPGGMRGVTTTGDDGPFRLVVVNRDGTDGTVYSLMGNQIDLGRLEGDLLFDDPHLAPRHARIISSSGARVLADLETRNGVYRRLRAPTDLSEGDEILIGKQVLQFEDVPEGEKNLRPAIDHGVVLFGTTARPAWGRLRRIASTGLSHDIFHLTRNDVVLGREQGDVIFADDEFMSRRHAQLSVRAGRCTIEDLASSNGTFIRLRAPHTLVAGDQIRMGDVLLRFEVA